MDETSKTKRIWGPLEKSIIVGKGIDIGCGPDPISPGVRTFETSDGDANRITEFVHEQFDFVYSSHCLEHMREPRKALFEWWQLVKPGGHLFFIVPDEDLYEQGVFPSRFNSDHKATFTISKSTSWSPVSYNVLDLAKELPNSEIVNLVLQDHNYDRYLMKHGDDKSKRPILRFLFRIYRILKHHGLFRIPLFETFAYRPLIDQTLRNDVLAQIQCILRKKA
jgi:ubiquinone/menaquinone biosynthesis C-methylase UbiE